MTIEAEERADELVKDLGNQVGQHTDFLSVRNSATGECGGYAACIHVLFEGREYSVSCQHVLKAKSEYFTGPRQLAIDRITEQDEKRPGVPPLHLVAESVPLDLALFAHPGLDLASIPKRSYPLGPNVIDFERASRNKRTLGFICGTPAFAARQESYSDGTIYLNTPIYKGYGPIIAVETDRITGDFAEAKLVEVTNAEGSKIERFQPSGGARDLRGMSGSGLWVHCEHRFHLAGILRGPEKGSETARSHIIEFTPVWKLLEWVRLPQTQLAISEAIDL